jgi:predicted AAA+ superfamily ATPase
VEQKYGVFITGSNSALLSKEYATKLGGRYIEMEVLPLSFGEFLDFKKFQWRENKERIFYGWKKHKIMNYFEEFLNFGGFPELALSNYSGSLKERILESYFESTIYRDVILHYSLGEPGILRLLVKKLSENIGKAFSFRSLVNKINSLGWKTNVNTIMKYYDALKDVFFLVESNQETKSFLKSQRERKVYFVDNGYLRLFFENEKSRLFENLVALEIYRKSGRLHYFRNSYEVDFVGEVPVQVCYELNQNNKDREIRGILHFLNGPNCHNCTHGFIITYDQESTIQKNNKTIHILPVWKWLLGMHNENVLTKKDKY